MCYSSAFEERKDLWASWGGIGKLLCNLENMRGCIQSCLCTVDTQCQSASSAGKTDFFSCSCKGHLFFFQARVLVAELNVLACRAQQSEHWLLCQTIVLWFGRALSHSVNIHGVLSISLFSFYKSCFWKGFFNLSSGRKNTVSIDFAGYLRQSLVLLSLDNLRHPL